MVKSQGEGGLDDPVCGCLLCRKGGKEGVPHSLCLIKQRLAPAE